MRTNAKTFIIIGPGFADSEADTTCLPMQQQFVLQLQESYPHLHIIVLAFHYPFKKATYQWNSIEVISLNGGNKGGLSRLWMWYVASRKLSRLHKQYNIAGVLSFWYTECAVIGKFFAKKRGIKHVTWILGQDAKKENNYVKRIPPTESELIALSDFIAGEFHRNHGIRPRHIIPAGIDPRVFPQQLNERDIDVLGAGSLIPLKRYDIFINVIAQAAKTIPAIRAFIFGKGPEQNVMQSQVNAKGLLANVFLPGELPYPEVLKHMRRTKVFLHTSEYEGFGMVCLEALYAGAHVISFTRPMEQDFAHWHIVNTKEEMLQKLLDLLNDPHLDHSPIIPFDMKDTVDAMMQLYHIT